MESIEQKPPAPTPPVSFHKEHLLVHRLTEHSERCQSLIIDLRRLRSYFKPYRRGQQDVVDIMNTLTSIFGRLPELQSPASRFLNASSMGVFELAGEFHESAHAAVRRISLVIGNEALLNGLATLAKGRETLVLLVLPYDAPKDPSDAPPSKRPTPLQLRAARMPDFIQETARLIQALEPRLEWLSICLDFEFDRAMTHFAPNAVPPDKGIEGAILVLTPSKAWIGGSREYPIEPHQFPFLKALIDMKGKCLTAKHYRQTDSDKADLGELIKGSSD